MYIQWPVYIHLVLGPCSWCDREDERVGTQSCNEIN